MTSEELTSEINARKINAWSYLHMLARATPADLKAAGYAKHSNAQAVLQAFQQECIRIENMIRKWERDNPLD